MSDPTTTPTPTETRRWKPLTSPENLAAIEAALEPEVDETPTEPHHDVREEWAARLQCADVGVDFPWLTEDGCDVWHEQPVATQEHYRRLLDLALSAGLQIPPTAAVSAAAPDERDALERALSTLYNAEDGSREKDAAYDVLAAHIRTLAARPAPVVSGEAVVEWGVACPLDGEVEPCNYAETIGDASQVRAHHDRNCGPGHTVVRRTVTRWTTVADAPAAEAGER